MSHRISATIHLKCAHFECVIAGLYPKGGFLMIRTKVENISTEEEKKTSKLKSILWKFRFELW